MFGVTDAILDGLDELDRALRRRVRRRADRSARIRARTSGWSRPGSRRSAFALCGPALAIGREPGGPAFVAADEWELDVDAAAASCVTSAADRAHTRSFARRSRSGARSSTAEFSPERAGMAKRALISADNHVFEPVTLWQERLPDAVPRPRAARRAARRLDRDGDRGHARPQAHAHERRRATASERRARGRRAPAAPTSTAGCATWRSTASSPR